jgi:hypothetical protein
MGKPNLAQRLNEELAERRLCGCTEADPCEQHQEFARVHRRGGRGGKRRKAAPPTQNPRDAA